MKCRMATQETQEPGAVANVTFQEVDLSGVIDRLTSMAQFSSNIN